MHYLLIITAVYGLVNSNAKRQGYSDDARYKVVFNQVTVIPIVFYKTKKKSYSNCYKTCESHLSGW